MASDRTSNNPPHVTEFASERYFEKLRQLERDAAQGSTSALQSGITLPIPQSKPAAYKSQLKWSQKRPAPRNDLLKPPQQSESSLSKSSRVKLKAEQRSVSLDRFFTVLPSELQIQIISTLPLSDLLNLRLTSRWWHTLITLNEVPIASSHLDHYIPAYAQRLYPVTDQLCLSLHHICGLWHRYHVVSKLSLRMSKWATKDIFLRQTNAQQTAFAPQSELMRRRLTWLLFHIFHFFETYRTLHLEYIKHRGHGLKREPYVLNPIETQVMAMYDGDTLLRMHEVFPFVVASFCRRLRPPTYAGRVERSLRGYIKDRPSDEVTVAIMCIGGLGQVARLWGIKGYNTRRNAVDEWYTGITRKEDEAKPGFRLRRSFMRLGSKSGLDEGPAKVLQRRDSSYEVAINKNEETNLVFNTSMRAGKPMPALKGDELERLIPDLPILKDIWRMTAEALIINGNVVERVQDIKRNQQVMLDLIRGEDEDEDQEDEDQEDERWYGEFAPQPVERMGEQSFESDQGSDQSANSSAEEAPDSELPQPKEYGESLLAPFTSIALCWYALMKILDRPPKNSKRVTYRCGCGDLRYLDVEELVPGGAEELQEILRAEARAVRQRSPDQGSSSSSLPASPPEVHLIPLGQRHSQAHNQPAQDSEYKGPSESRILHKSSTNRTLVLPNRQKQLIVCINTKRGLVTPQHLDVSSVTNDQYLFESIKTTYSEVRQEHEWNLAALFSGKINIPSWILKLLSITPPKHIQLPNWLGHHFEKCTFFVPQKAEFVQFQLMPIRKEIYAGNLVKPEVPGYEEVTVKRTYEYRPVPLKVKIISIPFLHELLGPGEHLGLFWWNRFPKKLDGALVWDEDADCMGWGIHITEGWNKPLILVLALLLMSLFGIFVIVYSVLTHDGSTGAGIGSFLMAFLTLYCWLRYEGWKSG